MNNSIPTIVNPLHLQFDCANKCIYTPDNYKIVLNGDPNRDIMTINIHDKTYYLSTQDAISLSNHIKEKAEELKSSHEILLKEKAFIDTLKVFLSQNIVSNIIIIPKGIYTSDVSNIMFGCMVMNVNYTLMSGKEYNMDIVSEKYTFKDIPKYKNISNELRSNHSNLKYIEFDNEKFETILRYIDTLFDTYTKEVHKEWKENRNNE